MSQNSDRKRQCGGGVAANAAADDNNDAAADAQPLLHSILYSRKTLLTAQSPNRDAYMLKSHRCNTLLQQICNAIISLRRVRLKEKYIFPK